MTERRVSSVVSVPARRVDDRPWTRNPPRLGCCQACARALADLAATRAENERLREALTWLCNSVEADYTPTDSRGKQTKQAIQRADAVLADGREENTDGR